MAQAVARERSCVDENVPPLFLASSSFLRIGQRNGEPLAGGFGVADKGFDGAVCALRRGGELWPDLCNAFGVNWMVMVCISQGAPLRCDPGLWSETPSA